MNKNQAQAWMDELTKLLSDKDLITVSVTPIGTKVTVRQHQRFNKAYIVEYNNDKYSVALSDSYGVMTGSNDWQIDPNSRTVLCHCTNSYNEPLHYTWTITDNDDNGKLWHEMKDIQEKLWKVR